MIPAPKLGSQGIIVMLCCINLINYMDRGIISGAPESFRHFITSSLGVPVTNQTVYFGLLSSAFIIGHSILSIVFGYFALKCRPFRLIALGMSIWILAVIICGISKPTNSYAVLVVGRVISGVGEASFQCIAPPFIDRHAPAARRSFYLGIYLTSVVVGGAIGYIYGSLFADSVFTWAGAFYFEAILMAFLVAACLFSVPPEMNRLPKDEDSAGEHSPSELASDLLSVKNSPTENDSDLSANPIVASEKQESAYRIWWEVLTNTPFMLIVLGNGAYTFTLSVFNTYGPDIFLGLELFDSETSASFAFGGIVAIMSLIGTPIGGMVLDKVAKEDATPARRCFVATVSLVIYVVIAEVFALGLYAFASDKIPFLACFAVALFGMCALWGPQMVALLELFPETRRSLAISVNAVVVHIFGDIPAPTIMGVVRDAWAPLCGTVEIDGHTKLNPECYKDFSGLKNFMLLTVLWLTWAVLLWSVATFAIKRHQRLGRFPTPAAAPSDTQST